VIYLKDLIAATGIKPSVNQVELHPYLHQDNLLEYARMEGIHLTGYFPLGGTRASVFGCAILNTQYGP
jgi:diketogulonate reductase-like aldo/keto reductase